MRPPHFRLNGSARRSVADRVVEEIDDEPAEELFIARERKVDVGVAFEGDAARAGEAVHRAAAIGYQLVEVELADLELDMAPVGAGQIQQIVHETGEAARFVEDDAESFAVFR